MLGRHATWYGLSVFNTDFGLFLDDTAISQRDTDLRQITEKQFMNMCSETKQFYRDTTTFFRQISEKWEILLRCNTIELASESEAYT